MQINPYLKQPFLFPTWEDYKGQIKQQALTFIAVLALSLLIGYGSSKLFTNLQTHTAITQFINASKKEKIARFFYSAVLPPIWEEAVFRGLLPQGMEWLQSQMGFDETSEISKWTRIALNVALFDALHWNYSHNWQSNVVDLAQLLPLSCQLAYVGEKTGHVYTAMSWHFAFNASHLVLTLI